MIFKPKTVLNGFLVWNWAFKGIFNIFFVGITFVVGQLGWRAASWRSCGGS